MTDLPEYPLVTFALFAYNQEKYIREAVEGAFSQDYPNLEIIISDDCSTDGTWAAIEELVGEYTGPHRVVLNRNERNLGICGHVNKIFELAEGPLVVMAAGDDISVTDRTKQIVDAWLIAGRPIAAIHSAARVIESSGHPTGAVVKGKAASGAQVDIASFIKLGFRPQIHGATAAYTVEQFELFGPLTGGIEDVPMTFRTLLEGQLIYVDSPLIRYRMGDGNVSKKMTRSDRAHIAKWINYQIEKIRCLRKDYTTHCNRLNTQPDAHIVSRFDLLNR